MKTKHYYTAVLQKEDNGYMIWFPDLDGCNSFGESVSEAIEKSKEALGLYLEVLVERNEDIAEPSNPETIKVEEGQFVAVVEFDRLVYQKKYCSTPVEKVLTIPMYLNTLAEKEQVNFSSLLCEALENRYYNQSV
ncbi:MAG: type II toxin-antitoxin system HicB family antitoxin [Oscillospiraceae bacterium]|nr:type II toxin-antitoxin system HicB family antitoxin [Oscillospiraceae bacterium]